MRTFQTSMSKRHDACRRQQPPTRTSRKLALDDLTRTYSKHSRRCSERHSRLEMKRMARAFARTHARPNPPLDASPHSKFAPLSIFTASLVRRHGEPSGWTPWILCSAMLPSFTVQKHAAKRSSLTSGGHASGAAPLCHARLCKFRLHALFAMAKLLIAYRMPIATCSFSASRIPYPSFPSYFARQHAVSWSRTRLPLPHPRPWARHSTSFKFRLARCIASRLDQTIPIKAVVALSRL
ncbi:hypothetical protein CBOM_07740 [Ceraceosorus bombacis]|uniref:Uncharacterized protein n=1 Tax=Ceraceosorus bombacis TaxID=401625 RepID=A0A0P1BGY9_9BASI|nr:hypothetical protein CBOM_07740 [Ceraceosorus bombacis]